MRWHRQTLINLETLVHPQQRRLAILREQISDYPMWGTSLLPHGTIPSSSPWSPLQPLHQPRPTDPRMNHLLPLRSSKHTKTPKTSSCETITLSNGKDNDQGTNRLEATTLRSADKQFSCINSDEWCQFDDNESLAKKISPTLIYSRLLKVQRRCQTK